MDYRAKIIEELDVMREKEVREKQPFKARAYAKVLAGLRERTTPIMTIEDVNGIHGIGDKILEKIKEIITTGVLAAAERLKASPKSVFFKELIKVHGIGAVKANSLIDGGKIHSIAELRAAVASNPKLLNKVQQLGLKYYEDILQRIPRDEVRKHEEIIHTAFDAVDTRFTATLVGSYRRGMPDSGDIDVLVVLPSGASSHPEKLFKEAVTKMKTDGYILDILALGPKKCMAVVRTSGAGAGVGVARRLDILLTSPEEYPYAILYFTGSDKFNINFRKQTLTQGYSINEHGATRTRQDVPEAPVMHTEQDIFTFFKIPYVTPQNRL